MRKPRLGTILLALWGLLLTAAVAVYLMYLQPARLGRTVSDTLESALGLKCSIRQVDLSVFPRVAVVIRGIRLEPGAVPNLEFRADSCRAELSWLSLLSFRPVLRAVDLQSPVTDIVWPLRPIAPGRSVAAENVTRAAPPLLPTLPPVLAGVRIRLSNGALRVRTADGSRRIQLGGVNGRARLPGLFSGNVDLHVGKTSLRLAPAPEISLDGFTLKASSLHGDGADELTGSLELSALVQIASLEEALGRPVKPAYRYFPMPEPARVEARVNVSAAPAKRRFSMDGRLKTSLVLPMNGHDTPIALTLPFRMDTPAALRVEGMDLDMDGDRAVLTGEVTGLAARAPVFTGQARVQHFSLTRWFGFGHKMTAGLQHALNDISGTMDFVLTPRGVEAPRLEARLRSLDATLVGSGGCADFRAPDIVIEGHVASVDLNPAFPEINGHKPDKPVLPPPAVPLEDDGNPSRVGYDIHLTADKAAIWKLEAGKVDCRITPVPLSAAQKAEEARLRAKAEQEGRKPPPPWKSGGHGALLVIGVGDLYGGRGDAVARLGDIYRVQAKVDGVSAEAPFTRMAGYAAVGGTLQGTTDFTFSGSSAAEMMSRLDGTLDASLSKGFLGSRAGRRTPCRNLTIKADAQAVPPPKLPRDGLPASMDFRGSWKATLDTVDWTLHADSRSTIAFSMSNGLPLSMQPQAAALRLRLDKNGMGKGMWPEDLVLDVQAKTSFDMQAGALTLEDISGGRPGLTLGGALRMSELFGTPVTEGRMSARTGALRSTARAFGLSLPATVNPAMLASLAVEADVRHSGDSLELKKLAGSLDSTSLGGSISATLGERPFWSATLHLGAIDADAYWPAPARGPATPVQAEFLQNHDADLRLSVKQLILFGTPTVDVRLPVTLKKGVLDSSVFTAGFAGGGKASGALHAEARGRDASGGRLDGRLQLRLSDVNMLALSQARGQESLVAGTGEGRLDLQAALRTWSDIPGKLDGNWSVSVRDGYIMSAKAAAEAARQPQASAPAGFGMEAPPPGQAAAARTPFHTLSASGSLLAGVVASNDFLLDGTMLKVKGGGTINLNTMTIDAKATATLLGVPEVPVEISGRLDDPRTTYKLMGAVAGTIGNIGGTVVDMVGGIITAPFRLFMGKKTIK